ESSHQPSVDLGGRGRISCNAGSRCEFNSLPPAANCQPQTNLAAWNDFLSASVPKVHFHCQVVQQKKELSNLESELRRCCLAPAEVPFCCQDVKAVPCRMPLSCEALA